MPYSTRYAAEAIVSTVDGLAAGAGALALRAGGCAVDAAIAAAAVLAVTHQHQCGLGGDLLALVHRPAVDGFAASESLAAAAQLIAGVPEADDYTTGGPLMAGQVVRRPGVARALAAIALESRRGFYEGEFGQALLELGGGEYSSADLVRSQAEWVAGRLRASACPRGPRSGPLVRRADRAWPPGRAAAAVPGRVRSRPADHLRR